MSTRREMMGWLLLMVTVVAITYWILDTQGPLNSPAPTTIERLEHEIPQP